MSSHDVGRDKKEVVNLSKSALSETQPSASLDFDIVNLPKTPHQTILWGDRCVRQAQMCLHILSHASDEIFTSFLDVVEKHDQLILPLQGIKIAPVLWQERQPLPLHRQLQLLCLRCNSLTSNHSKELRSLTNTLSKVLAASGDVWKPSLQDLEKWEKALLHVGALLEKDNPDAYRRFCEGLIATSSSPSLRFFNALGSVLLAEEMYARKCKFGSGTVKNVVPTRAFTEELALLKQALPTVAEFRHNCPRLVARYSKTASDLVVFTKENGLASVQRETAWKSLLKTDDVDAIVNETRGYVRFLLDTVSAPSVAARVLGRTVVRIQELTRDKWSSPLFSLCADQIDVLVAQADQMQLDPQQGPPNYTTAITALRRLCDLASEHPHVTFKLGLQLHSKLRLLEYSAEPESNARSSALVHCSDAVIQWAERGEVWALSYLNVVLSLHKENSDLSNVIRTLDHLIKGAAGVPSIDLSLLKQQRIQYLLQNHSLGEVHCFERARHLIDDVPQSGASLGSQFLYKVNSLLMKRFVSLDSSVRAPLLEVLNLACHDDLDREHLLLCAGPLLEVMYQIIRHNVFDATMACKRLWKILGAGRDTIEVLRENGMSVQEPVLIQLLETCGEYIRARSIRERSELRKNSDQTPSSDGDSDLQPPETPN